MYLIVKEITMATKTKRHKKYRFTAARKRALRKAWAARRKAGRKTRRHAKGKKCPKVRGRASLRAAKLCLARKKAGRVSKKNKAVYAKCRRMLRRTKAGRRWLKKHGK